MTSEQATLLTSLLDSGDSASNIKPAEVNSNLVAAEFIIKLQPLKTERISFCGPKFFYTGWCSSTCNRLQITFHPL